MAKKWYFFLVILLSVHTITWADKRAPTSGNLMLHESPPIIHHKLDPYQLDSIALAHRKHIQDSLKVIGDSLALIWIKKPNLNRPNPFLDSLISVYKVENLNFSAWGNKFPKKQTQPIEGRIRPQRELWIIGVIFVLVIFFALIKVIFSKHLHEMILLFYNNKSLLRKKRDDNLFNSWAFLFLYILFGLTSGMYLYLSEKYISIQYSNKGFQWFLLLSALVMGIFTAKMLVLRLVGFLFDIQKPIKEHIATLYLFFSNSALILLPVILSLSLLPHSFIKTYSYATIILLILILAFQLFRAFFRILFGYQFSIIYLFIYICVLEICPLIIFIKVFRF